MATETVFGKQTRSLGEGILAEQRHCPGDRDLVGTAGQFLDPLGIAVRLENRGLVRFAVSVLVESQQRQCPNPDRQHPRESHVELVSARPTTEQRHGRDHGHQRPGHINRPERQTKMLDELELQEPEQKQEIPLWSCRRIIFCRIRRRTQFGSLPDRQPEHQQQYGQAGNAVLEHLVRPKRGFGRMIFVLDRQAMPPKDVQVQAQEGNKRGRKQPGMQREESRQGVVTIFRPALDQFLCFHTDDRCVAHDLGRHLCRVISLLVPWQQVPGQGQSEHDLHQHQAQPKIHLTWRLVRPVNDHLHQVHSHQNDHQLCREMVQPPDDRPKRHLVLNVIHALPGRIGTGTVSGPQEESGDHLHAEGEDQRAAPDVTPTGSAGDPFVECLVQNTGVSGAVVEPSQQTADHISTFSEIPPRKFLN